MVYHTKGDISSALSSIGPRRTTSSLIGKTLSISSQALVISSSGRLPPLLARIGRLATTLLSHGWLINIPKLDNYLSREVPMGCMVPNHVPDPCLGPLGFFSGGSWSCSHSLTSSFCSSQCFLSSLSFRNQKESVSWAIIQVSLTPPWYSSDVV